MADQQPGQIINPNNAQNQTPNQQVAVQQTNISPIQSAQAEQSEVISQTQPQEAQPITVNTQPLTTNNQSLADTSPFTSTGFAIEEDNYTKTYNQPSGEYSNPYSEELPEAVTWTASEYINHHKSSAWFAGLAVAVALAALGVFFVTKDVLSAIVIVVVGIVFGMYAGRKPRELTYIINNEGVFIGEKIYTYDRFKAFSIAQEGPMTSIVFTPMGRFMPFISIYYDPQDEEKIAETLSAYLPYEDHKRDPVDALMRKIRF